MKGSAFIWFIGMLGFIIVGLLWAGFFSSIESVTGVGADLINETVGVNETSTVTTFNILTSVMKYWPLIVMIAIAIYMLINSQKPQGGFG